jgi:hypothetical protein
MNAPTPDALLGLMTADELLALNNAKNCYSQAVGYLSRAAAVTDPPEIAAMAQLSQAYAFTGLLGLLHTVTTVVGRQMAEEAL